MSIVLDGLSWILLVAGGLVSVVAGIGLLRFPDVFSRMHAASMLDTLGAMCVLGGLLLQAGFGVVGFKLVLVFFFLAFTTSAAAHALAKSALAAGLEPVTGPVARAGGAATSPAQDGPDGVRDGQGGGA